MIMAAFLKFDKKTGPAVVLPHELVPRCAKDSRKTDYR